MDMPAHTGHQGHTHHAPQGPSTTRGAEGSCLRHDGDRAVTAPSRTRRAPVLLLQRKVSGEVRSRTGAVRTVRRENARTRHGRSRAGDWNDLHLPDAPGDPAGPPGQLPEVRDDAGAGAARTGRGQELGTRRFPAPLLVDPAADGGRYGAGDAGPPAGRVRHGGPELDRTGAGVTDRALGRLALLRAGGSVDREPQPEHVDADRARHRCSLSLQRRGHGGAERVPGLVHLDGAGRGVLRSGSRDCLADVARPDPRVEGALANLGGNQVAARADTQDRTPHCSRWQRGGCSARARARR